MLQHVPGLCLLEGVWVEPSAADRGQECRLNQRRILGFGRHGQFQEVKPRWVTADVDGPSLGGDVVPRFTLPPLMGLDRAFHHLIATSNEQFGARVRIDCFGSLQQLQSAMGIGAC